MREIEALFAREEEFGDLDAAGAVERLSRAIQYPTINWADHSRTDFAPFEGLLAHIRASYPTLMERGKLERIGHGVLITIPGRDPALRPCLYMSHQDVVPVVEGTEGDWTHPPFSGAVADGYIWGRGALDIKQQVFGLLEAAEYLLRRGATFARTAYLAFGDDEETLNLGARAIARELERRGVTLEFVLDEGSGKVEPGDALGAPGVLISPIGLMEKGYADLELSVRSGGGHSSCPFGGTSLGRLARAIAQIADLPPRRGLTPVVEGMFRAVAPYVTREPLKTLVADLEGNRAEIARLCAGERRMFPWVTTTVAPTVIRGSSSACNVLPQDMQAVINFRLMEGDSAEAVLDRCRRAVSDPGVELRFLQSNDPSATARTDGPGYRLLTESMGRYYPEVVFVPGLSVTATDARRYEGICDTCLRCSPFLNWAEEVDARVHGTDERISLRGYLQGIRVLIHLMERTNVHPDRA